MYRRSTLVMIVLTLVTLIFQWALTGSLGLVSGLLELTLFSAVFASVFFVFSLGRRRWKDGFLRAFLIIGSVTGFFILLVALAVTLANNFPGKLARITLTNGSGDTIVFYQMSHIASESYYREIKGELESYSQNGALIYIEGVKPGKPESYDLLDRTLGVKIGTGTYREIASVVGLVAQDESLYDRVSSGSIRHGDISIDEVASYISTGSLRVTPPVDMMEILALSGVTRTGRYIISEAMRAMMNLSIRSDLSSDMMMDVFPEDVRKAILDRRNESFVRIYREDSPKNAVFLYGALHFDGIYTLLRESDPTWKIGDIKPLYPYVR